MNKENLVFLILGIIILAHVLILTKLIYFPYPELFIYPYLTNHGLKPYSQILDQHFPGLLFLPINFDNLGMTTPEVARIWSITIVIIIHIMLFLISSEILKSKTKAIFINILYLVWQPFFEGWVLWIDNFLPLFLLPAFYALHKQKLFLCGLFLGIGIVFKQTLVPLFLLVLIYVFWQTKKIKPAILLFSGLLIPTGLMIVYLTSIGVLRDFWYWTVIFNLTTYVKEGRGFGPTLAHFTRVAVVFGTALLLLIPQIRKKETQILLIFLLGALSGLSTRFDFVHFQPALPFAIIATVYGLGRLGPTSPRFRGVKSLGIMSAYGVILLWWLVIFYKGHWGDRIISFDPQTRVIASKVKQLTQPGEKIFIFGAAPHLYQMSKTVPAGDIFVFQFPWFLQIAEKRILDGIMRDKPNIVVSDKTMIIEDQKITDFGKNLDQYLNQNYRKIDSIGTTDILQRNSTI